jgi:hypothetical protein
LNIHFPEAKRFIGNVYKTIWGKLCLPKVGRQGSSGADNVCYGASSPTLHGSTSFPLSCPEGVLGRVREGSATAALHPGPHPRLLNQGSGNPQHVVCVEQAAPAGTRLLSQGLGSTQTGVREVLKPELAKYSNRSW